MLELNKENFEKETEKGIVIVDLWAEWCGPCKAMSPLFEELSKEMKDIKFAKLNVDDNTDIAQKFGVMSIPTFIVFKNGKVIERIIGSSSKSNFKSKIETAVKK